MTPEHEHENKIMNDEDAPESEEIDGLDGDHQVPVDLLELHLQLEEDGVTPEEFKEVFGE